MGLYLWPGWSGAAENALADAHRFAGRPVPVRSLVVEHGAARFRVVRLGGPKVHRVRRSAADVHEAGGYIYVSRLVHRTFA